MISQLHNLNKRPRGRISALCLLLVALSVDPNNAMQSINNGEMLALAVDRHHNSPGHYEFEVAPKMEPPTVRKPPYQRSSFVCPGSDIRFPSFSTKDTLCGDLNQGRVPQNPLGQRVGDESYPFEVIKNKTLQFLARALPVLKLEYETIPKVARYLPANHLLNPTHQSSPLASDHMQQLNQRLASTNAFLDDSVGLTNDQLSQLMASGYPTLDGRAAKRRRKRATSPASHQTAYITVAEMSPNATLVVSSAHSSAGRIGGSGGAARMSVHNPQVAARLVDSPASLHANRSELGVITKDGFKTIVPNNPVTSSTLAAKKETTQRPQSGNSNGEQIGEQIGARNNQIVGNNGNGGDNRQQQFKSSPVLSGKKLTSSESAQGERSAPSLVDKTHENQQQASGRSQGDSPVMQTSGHQSSARSDHTTVASSNTPKSQSRRLNCGDSANGFTSAICQAASALIEGDRVPVWLQVARSIGNAYSVSPTTDQSNPVWSLLTSLVGSLAEPPNQAKSAGSSSTSSAASQQTKANLLSLVKPLSSLVSSVTSASSAQDKSDNKQESTQLASANSIANSLASSTWARLMMAGWVSNALTGLVEYLVPSVGNRGFAKRKKPFDPQETFVDTPASVAAALSASNALKQAGPGGKPPPTPCPSTEEYISPTFARNHQGAWKYVVQIPHEGYFTQTIQRTSCVRQKCEFTEGVCHESPRWVSLLVAEIYYPNAIFNQPAGTGIDPTGGAFSPTQMATASSTNNMVLAQQQQQQQQQQQLQQVQQHKDPLQMTDSLTNYNHNLNSAFISAANDLGWDPNNVQNMQHLAAAYKYQLLSRNGLLTGQQPAESRMAVAQSSPVYTHVQPHVQQMSNAAISAANNQAANQAILNSDYITALAMAALQQNPNLNVEELVNSLHLQAAQQQSSRRKKRDLGQSSVSNGQWSGQTHYRKPQTESDNIQSRSSGANVESLGTLNDLGSQSKQVGQQQQQISYAKQTSQQVLPSVLQQAGQSQEQHSMAQPGASGGGGNQQATMHDANSAASGDASTSQVECDGHDKIGCYVVRVYYDWFLVNGSCKCWKTNMGQAGSLSSGGNSLLRRIFTG